MIPTINYHCSNCFQLNVIYVQDVMSCFVIIILVMKFVAEGRTF